MQKRKSNPTATIVATLSLFVLLWVFCSSLYAVKEDAALYENVVRLHVLANSDREEDQALKLQVRDALLEKVTLLCADCTNRDDALARMKEEEESLRICAEQTVATAGYDYPVQFQFGTEYYPARTYDSVTLPAGEYESVRILLGEGAGQNWWCVLFPPLCVQASEAKETLVESGFTQNQIKILTESDNPRYRLRLKAVEVYEDWRSKFR